MIATNNEHVWLQGINKNGRGMPLEDLDKDVRSVE